MTVLTLTDAGGSGHAVTDGTTVSREVCADAPRPRSSAAHSNAAQSDAAQSGAVQPIADLPLASSQAAPLRVAPSRVMPSQVARSQVAPSPVARSQVRLRRAPLLEPPFDDERDDMPSPQTVELPIDWAPGGAQRWGQLSAPAGRHVRAGGRRSGIDGAIPATDDESNGIGDRRPRGESFLDGTASPRASRAGDAIRSPSTSPTLVATALGSAERYVRLCLEVLNGFRSAAHLRTLTGPVEFAEVVTQLNRRRNGLGYHGSPTPTPPGGAGATAWGSLTTVGGATTDSGAPTNRRQHAERRMPANRSSMFGIGAQPAPRRNTTSAIDPFRLLKLHVSEPCDGVAEVVAVLSHGGSSLAMAMRLERRAGRWLCALVQVI